jgi:hypothetical protein
MHEDTLIYTGVYQMHESCGSCTHTPVVPNLTLTASSLSATKDDPDQAAGLTQHTI